MRKLIAFAALALMPLTGMAGGAAVALEASNVDVANEEAIQRGAKYFANYCMGCHSMQYARYQVMEQAGLTTDEIKDNLIFDDSKPGGLMKIAMPSTDAASWFGAAAPDLTLEARLRKGPDWIYTYLKGFYSDPSRPFGVNNTLFSNVGMPNILWQLEGIKEAVYRYDIRQGGHIVKSFDNEAEANAYAEANEGAKVNKVVDHTVKVKEGTLSDAEFDQVARDLATYMAFISEPNQLERKEMGVKVVIFLIIFSILAYLMKKEWWREIH